MTWKSAVRYSAEDPPALTENPASIVPGATSHCGPASLLQATSTRSLSSVVTTRVVQPGGAVALDAGNPRSSDQPRGAVRSCDSPLRRSSPIVRPATGCADPLYTR